MKDKVFQGLRILALMLFTLIFLLPIIWIVLCSFKSNSELYQWPPSILPNNFTLENFIDAFSKGDFGLYLWNTVFVTIVATILTLIVNTMSGFALAKYKFKGSTFILMLFLSTLMIPLEVIIIPIFKMIGNVGLYDSLWGLIIPTIATPAGLFLIRQFMLGVPDELLEAARIDGAGELKLFITIIIPIAKPVLAVLTIFSFMWRWNDVIWPLIVISSPQNYTIQYAITSFIGEFSVNWSSLLAMSVVSMIPVLIVFLLFQKQFTSGFVTSGLKE